MSKINTASTAVAAIAGAAAAWFAFQAYSQYTDEMKLYDTARAVMYFYPNHVLRSSDGADYEGTTAGNWEGDYVEFTYAVENNSQVPIKQTIDFATYAILTGLDDQVPTLDVRIVFSDGYTKEHTSRFLVVPHGGVSRRTFRITTQELGRDALQNKNFLACVQLYSVAYPYFPKASEEVSELLSRIGVDNWESKSTFDITFKHPNFERRNDYSEDWCTANLTKIAQLVVEGAGAHGYNLNRKRLQDIVYPTELYPSGETELRDIPKLTFERKEVAVRYRQ
ncbi:hypothetical protein [Thalassospira povalilytica]|uniref:DUF4331 domain-containing protein n=1 Tax=Thalassospira povalilytica TaxID=732237 RepID=A0A8I1SK31_9PROT|nr:hypothetical protein [Thalassospira povalilytica]MBN8197006.1 hypothetical protein [Thalassospira povalilytica]